MYIYIYVFTENWACVASCLTYDSSIMLPWRQHVYSLQLSSKWCLRNEVYEFLSVITMQWTQQHHSIVDKRPNHLSPPWFCPHPESEVLFMTTSGFSILYV